MITFFLFVATAMISGSLGVLAAAAVRRPDDELLRGEYQLGYQHGLDRGIHLGGGRCDDREATVVVDLPGDGWPVDITCDCGHDDDTAIVNFPESVR